MTYLTLSEVELILFGEPNKELDIAWDYYDKAQQSWLDDNLLNAINFYVKAIRKID